MVPTFAVSWLSREWKCRRLGCPTFRPGWGDWGLTLRVVSPVSPSRRLPRMSGLNAPTQNFCPSVDHLINSFGIQVFVSMPSEEDPHCHCRGSRRSERVARRFAETRRDFQVVGKASTGAEALELIRREEPDVVVIDLFMPGTDGFEVLRVMEKAGLHVASVVLTASEKPCRLRAGSAAWRARPRY